MVTILIDNTASTSTFHVTVYINGSHHKIVGAKQIDQINVTRGDKVTLEGGEKIYSTKPTPIPALSPRPHPAPQTSPPRSKASPQPPTSPDNSTTQHGIVIHGIALREDLGKVRGWLEASNKEIGKTRGIRWLRKKTTLMEEGKKTSSAVLYLETQKDVGKVRLGGRWLRTEVYEPDRGRK
ncbi:hypothetical protein BDZ91DRAFT_804261 [Kalaharituber pfeilii]|nr:hypothetical protein BDZ91DRAFT_804261 [Kalaharituber pfeilii]